MVIKSQFCFLQQFIMKTFKVEISFRWKLICNVTAKSENDVEKEVHDSLMSWSISINDVSDRSDYDVDVIEETNFEDEEEDEPVIYDCQDWR